MEEIIIDGVDVSKCKHFKDKWVDYDENTEETIECEVNCCLAVTSSKCEEIKDCYYKQLQATQQIIRDLKKRVMQLEDCLGEATSEKCSPLLFKKIKHIESEE